MTSRVDAVSVAGPKSAIAFKSVIVLLALASLTVNFGLIDLIDGYSGFVDQARNQVLDAGWGVVFGIVLPFGLLTQLRSAERRIAGLQQCALVALALASAGTIGEAWRYLAFGTALGGLCGLLVYFHPARGAFLNPGRTRPAFLLLAAVAAGPALVYASRMASAQRRGLPPSDAVSNGLHHWSVMAALALSVLLLVVLAGLGTCGWRIPAWSAAAASFAWGFSCLLAPPGEAGSEGHIWAGAAIAWALTLAAAAQFEGRRSARSPHRSRCSVTAAGRRSSYRARGRRAGARPRRRAPAP